MPFNGSGGYNPPPTPYFPAVPGEIIYAERWNFQWNELYTALGGVVLRDGTAPMAADLPMATNRLTNLAAATGPGHAVEYSQWMAAFTGTVFNNVTINNSVASTPELAANGQEIATAEWVRDLTESMPGPTLPPTAGLAGQFLTNNGAGQVSWSPAPPDFVLMNLGVQ